MSTLPDLVGRIRLDLSDLDRARGEATQRGAAIGSALGSAVGNLAGGALAAAGAKVTDFVTGSIDAFAKLQDSTQAAGVVFGTSFGKVDQFAAGAAKSLGISKAAALDASLTFGTFGKAAGLAGDDLAGFSNGMVTLAGDMASFRGTSPEEAITAIGAAFRGEYDPIEKYGVLINANTVAQEAERMGLVKHGQELDSHAKILATQSLIYKQTSDAQGDFQRSGDSVANTQKRIAAETENAQAALGEKLAPAYLALLNAINPVIGAITAFIGVVVQVATFVWQWKDAIAGVLVVLAILNAQTIAFNVAAAAYLAVQAAIRVATIAWTSVQWLLNAALTANPIGLVIAAVAALVAGIIIAYNHSETFRNAVDALGVAFNGLITNALPAIIEWLTKLGVSLGQAVTDVENWGTKVGTSFMQAVADVDNFGNQVNALPPKIGSALGGLAQSLYTWVVQGWITATQRSNQEIDALLAWIQAIPGKVGGFLGGLANQVVNWIGSGFTRAKDIVNQANQALFGFIGSIPGRVDQALGGVPGKVMQFIGNAWQGAVDKAKQVGGTLVTWVQGLPQQILGALQALPGQMVTMGNQIIQGLLTGLQQLGPQIVAYLTNLIPEPVRNALNIHSPSGVMRDIGRDVMNGLDQGLSSLIPKIQATLAKVSGMIQGSVQVAGQTAQYSLQKQGNTISGSGSFAGQSATGSFDTSTGRGTVGFGGQSFNIDARSFGSQLNPKDVVDQILWKAKAGGLVPA